MQSRSRNPISLPYVLLIGLIVVVNLFTAVILIRHYFPAKNDQTGTDPSGKIGMEFAEPDRIMIGNPMGWRSVTPEDDLYIALIPHVNRRTATVAALEEFPDLQMADAGEVYLEYQYDTPVMITLLLQEEQRTVEASRVVFPLSGESGGYAMIETAADAILTVGTFPENPELTDFVTNFLFTNEE